MVSSKYLLFIIIFLWLCCSLTAAEMVVTQDIHELTNEFIRNNIKDLSGNWCCLLKVSTDLKSFDKVETSLAPMKVEPRIGEVWVYLSPGERRIYFSKTGYAKIVYDIPLIMESNCVYGMAILEKGANVPKALSVIIKVNPADAAVVINDTMQCDIGKAIKLLPGTYGLKISKPTYRMINEEITVDPDNVFFDYTLQPISQQKVTLTSSPSEVDIFMDDQYMGKTDKEVFRYPGTYTLKLIKSGYETYEQRIEVLENKENRFAVTLIKAGSTLSVITIPPAAKLYVDNQEVPSKMIDLSVGPHEMKVTCEGYEPYTKQITAVKGQNISESVTLISYKGELLFEVEPMKTAISLYDKYSYLQSWTGSNNLSLPVGDYTAKATLEGYMNQDKSFSIKKNETTKIELIMLKAIAGNNQPKSPNSTPSIESKTVSTTNQPATWTDPNAGKPITPVAPAKQSSWLDHFYFETNSEFGNKQLDDSHESSYQYYYGLFKAHLFPVAFCTKYCNYKFKSFNTYMIGDSTHYTSFNGQEEYWSMYADFYMSSSTRWRAEYVDYALQFVTGYGGRFYRFNFIYRDFLSESYKDEGLFMLRYSAAVKPQNNGYTDTQEMLLLRDDVLGQIYRSAYYAKLQFSSNDVKDKDAPVDGSMFLAEEGAYNVRFSYDYQLLTKNCTNSLFEAAAAGRGFSVQYANQYLNVEDSGSKSAGDPEKSSIYSYSSNVASLSAGYYFLDYEHFKLMNRHTFQYRDYLTKYANPLMVKLKDDWFNYTCSLLFGVNFDFAGATFNIESYLPEMKEDSQIEDMLLRISLNLSVSL